MVEWRSCDIYIVLSDKDIFFSLIFERKVQDFKQREYYLN